MSYVQDFGVIEPVAPDGSRTSCWQKGVLRTAFDRAVDAGTDMKFERHTGSA